MDIKNTQHTYGWMHKFLHWSISILFFTQCAIAVYFTRLHGSLRWLWFHRHATLGCIIGTLMLLRLLWRFSNPRVWALASWERLEINLAYCIHGLLYFCLFLIPITGYLRVTSNGRSLHVFGLTLHSFLPEPLAGELGGLHIYIACIAILLVCLHIAGVLWHVLVEKDATLRRML